MLNHMKKLTKYLITGSMIIVIGSCTDVLNQDPIDRVSDSDVWQQEELIEGYVADLYLRFPFNGHSTTMIKSTYEATGNVNDQNQWDFTTGGMSSTSESQGFWDYNFIRDINVFLNEIDDSPIFERTRNRLEGEVRALRAMVYFEKQKRYGGVPLVDEVIDPFEEIPERFLVRSPEEQIADFIDQELQAAIELMEENHTPKGRINRWTAHAVKARANLWAASIANFGTVEGEVGIPDNRANEFYEKAADAASAVIESGRYELYDEFTDRKENYYNLFLDQSNSEVIFERVYDGVNIGHSFNNSSPPTRFSDGHGAVVNPLLERLLMYENIDGSDDQPEFGPDHLYVDGIEPWANKDPRLHASVLFQGDEAWGTTIQSYEGLDPSPVPNPDAIISDHSAQYEGVETVGIDSRRYLNETNTSSGFYNRKYVHDTPLISPGRDDTNWIEYRLGEMYLILAEAEYELGNLGSAATALNATRERAGISLVDANSITQERVRLERLNELAQENHAWWDHRRWRNAIDYLDRTEPLSGLRTILHYETGQFYFLDLEAEVFTRQFREEHYYHPILESRIENQPQLTQNPGY